MNDSRQKGLGLIEVLVAWAILMIGLTAVLRVQTVGGRRVYRAYLHSVAVTQVDNLIERYRAAPNKQARQQEKNKWLAITQHVLPDVHAQVQWMGRQMILHLDWLAQDHQSISVSTDF